MLLSLPLDCHAPMRPEWPSPQAHLHVTRRETMAAENKSQCNVKQVALCCKQTRPLSYSSAAYNNNPSSPTHLHFAVRIPPKTRHSPSLTHGQKTPFRSISPTAIANTSRISRKRSTRINNHVFHEARQLRTFLLLVCCTSISEYVFTGG